MTVFVRYGGTRSSAECPMIATTATTHLAAIRPQIREQPPHEAAVVGFAEDVIVDHDAFSSSSSSCLR